MRLKYILHSWCVTPSKNLEDLWDVEDSDGNLIIGEINQKCAFLLSYQRTHYIDTVCQLINKIEKGYKGDILSDVLDEIFETLTKRGEKCLHM